MMLLAPAVGNAHAQDPKEAVKIKYLISNG
jgi:hypothetical protein